MNIKLIRASIIMLVAVFVLLPYAVSAVAVIDLGPGVAAAAGEPGVESVETQFNETGKLLALMPVKFTVTVRVDPDGNVLLEYPWYSRFSVDRRETLLAELNVAVDNALRALTVGSVRAEGEAELKKEFSSEEAVAVLTAVNRVLEENFGTEALE